MFTAAGLRLAGPKLLWQVVDHAMQLLGGRGYIETNGLARIFRDALPLCHPHARGGHRSCDASMHWLFA